MVDPPRWNPVTGCRHGCRYCWARSLATSRLKNNERYKHGFPPRLNKEELDRRFRNKNIFVSSMGDLFGEWVPDEWIEEVTRTIERSPTSTFLLLTKNPKRFREFVDIFPDNVILGTTIETNKNFDITSDKMTRRPQSRRDRYLAMKKLEWKRKFVAIEPLMDFDPKVFEKWIKEIRPEKVSISYNNYDRQSPFYKVDGEKTIKFCKKLARFTLVLPHGDWVKKASTRKKLPS